MVGFALLKDFLNLLQQSLGASLIVHRYMQNQLFQIEKVFLNQIYEQIVLARLMAEVLMCKWRQAWLCHPLPVQHKLNQHLRHQFVDVLELSHLFLQPISDCYYQADR
jgi:hypothetical protein